MRIIATDFHTLLSPAQCERRVYLDARATEAAEVSEFDEWLFAAGAAHEAGHLATLGPYVDLGEGGEDDRVARTGAALKSGEAVLYQGELRAEIDLGGKTWTVVGAPDFILLGACGKPSGKGGAHIIRDSKLARRIADKDHPEIFRQLELYGWLYEKTLGAPPAGLEVHAGDGSIVPIDYPGAAAVEARLEALAAAKGAATEPPAIVGRTKCGDCAFNDDCWPRAEAARDVALVYGADQGLARQLHADGTHTYDALAADYTEDALADLSRPWGQGSQRVGSAAGAILTGARALSTGKPQRLGPLPAFAEKNYVMFDLEGIPPYTEPETLIYLWGMQVYGQSPGPFLPALAGFDDQGDEHGWNEFLRIAGDLFREHGDIPFVHWHSYERTHVTAYMDHYGDPGGIAARVLDNLLDLLPITRGALALPVTSYSLKVIEQYVGFERSQEEFGGTWSIAQYMAAQEMKPGAERDAIVAEILKYNEEDLAATWAVLDWLRGL